MQWYPFDVQDCQMILSMKIADDPFTLLVDPTLKYANQQSTGCNLNIHQVQRSTSPAEI
jgi:hypothetical protein